MNQKVAIVIVNWNKRDYVINLLRSLERIDYENHEIIVVDNASTDGSVDVIKKTFPDVTLLVNKENLGGTGGFNTGMRYALQNTDCKYIWLLDNDAEVERHTLIELVKAMEADANIGIAGSRIMSPENRDLIVELGGFIDWKSMTWKPNLRYIKEKDYAGPNIIKVDYVAICSALVRKEVIHLIGLMDPRFFLHWDDIDFCLRIKRAGYNVVAVFQSIVFHGVEKGFNPQILYYDFRNALLIISKHLKGMQRFLSVANLLKISLEALFFFFFEKKIFETKHIFFALYDFCLNNFGKQKREIKQSVYSSNFTTSKQNYSPEDKIRSEKNILIFQDGSYPEVKKAIYAVRKLAPDASLTMLVQKDKKNLFEGTPVNNFIAFDLFKDPFLKKIRLFLNLLFSHYGVGINTSTSYNLPYVYCIRKNITYDANREVFNISEKNVIKLWKIFLSVLLGNTLGVVLFSPVFYFFTFKYKSVWEKSRV